MSASPPSRTTRFPVAGWPERARFSSRGTEHTSHAIFAWAKEQRVEWHGMMPGTPMQNGDIGSLNGKLRDEPPNGTQLFSLHQA
jgi:transposase InsO family protein